MKVFSQGGKFFAVGEDQIILIEIACKSLDKFFENPQSFVDEAEQSKQTRPVDLTKFSTLDPPVSPSKIVCVGRNYAEHAKELGNIVPDEPLLFLKPPSSLVGHGGDVIYPTTCQLLHHEAELGVVIAKRGRNLSREMAANYIAGFTVSVDVTARDLQRKDKTWLRGKGYDTFCPVGPFVACNDDLSLVKAQDVEIQLKVNGEIRQKARTSEMIFKVDELIEYISSIMTLFPGDLILTGTPSGVGTLNRGDVIETTIEGIGTLRNKVV
ncbi:MAG: fumarylacetoacetate hydrolase family protein [Candidatus Odinarchaeota archaeon]